MLQESVRNKTAVAGDVNAILFIFAVVRASEDWEKRKGVRRKQVGLESASATEPEMKVNRMLSESWSKHPASSSLLSMWQHPPDFDSELKFFHAK